MLIVIKMAYSGPAFGSVSHLLTNVYDAAGDYYECITVTSSHLIYRKRNSTGFASTGHNIKFAKAPSNAWQDGSSNNWPVFYGATNTNGATQIYPDETATILHLFHTTGSNNYLFSLNTNLPSSGGGSSGGTTTEGVTVYEPDAKIVNFVGLTGYRFEQRGYPAASYQLTGDGFTNSWTLTSQTNDLQHHISNLSVGTYYLYQDSVLVATLKARSKVSCNFW